VSDSRYQVLLVSSSGGVLLDLLALRPWWFRHGVTWVAVPAPDTAALLKDERVHWQPELSARRPLTILTAVFRALRIVRAEHPDVIVSAGSGVAVAVFIAARLLGVPALWLETLNIVDRPGIAGRICGKLAAAVLVQRPALLESRPRAVLLGELY
jgi:UDP-N-acetylglucosamine:LPS N-acetylglucosamine transferase